MAKINLGETAFEIIDAEEVRPLAADIFTECRWNGSFVCMAFAAITIDGDGPALARVNTRLRISLATAADLRNAFDGILKAQMPGKDKAN